VFNWVWGQMNWQTNTVKTWTIITSYYGQGPGDRVAEAFAEYLQQGKYGLALGLLRLMKGLGNEDLIKGIL